MKYLIFGLLISLVLFSCDRFEHKFEPETPEGNEIEEFFGDLNTALDQITAADVSAVMAFYDTIADAQPQTGTFQTQAVFRISTLCRKERVKYL